MELSSVKEDNMTDIWEVNEAAMRSISGEIDGDLELLYLPTDPPDQNSLLDHFNDVGLFFGATYLGDGRYQRGPFSWECTEGGDGDVLEISYRAGTDRAVSMRWRLVPEETSAVAEGGSQ